MRTSSAPFCGNTVTEIGETCDDGANNGLAGYCNATCTGTVAVSLCGNGTINAGEACDDGNNTNGDACSATCQFELPSCSLNVQSYQSLNPLSVILLDLDLGLCKYLADYPMEIVHLKVILV